MNSITVTLLFAFGLCALSTAAPSPRMLSPLFICPQSSGFFHHPTDAHKFIECVNGHAYEYTCPANLVFNLMSETCDYHAEPSWWHPSTISPHHTVPTGTRHRHTDPVTVTVPMDGTTTTTTSTTPAPVSTRGRHHDN